MAVASKRGFLQNIFKLTSFSLVLLVADSLYEVGLSIGCKLLGAVIAIASVAWVNITRLQHWLSDLTLVPHLKLLLIVIICKIVLLVLQCALQVWNISILISHLLTAFGAVHGSCCSSVADCDSFISSHLMNENTTQQNLQRHKNSSSLIVIIAINIIWNFNSFKRNGEMECNCL